MMEEATSEGGRGRDKNEGGHMENLLRNRGFTNGPDFHQFPRVVWEEASLYKIKMSKGGKPDWVSAHGRLWFPVRQQSCHIFSLRPNGID